MKIYFFKQVICQIQIVSFRTKNDDDKDKLDKEKNNKIAEGLKDFLVY